MTWALFLCFGWVHEAAQLAFPGCYTELSVAPVTETENEMIMRVTSDIPHMPLLDEWDDCLDDADYVAVMALPLCQRPHAEAIAIKAMRLVNRASNAAIALKNADNSRERADRYEREFAKVDARPRLAAWLVSSEVMPSTIHAELKVDRRYVAGADGFVPAHVIMEIACRVLGVVSRSDQSKGALRGPRANQAIPSVARDAGVSRKRVDDWPEAVGTSCSELMITECPDAPYGDPCAMNVESPGTSESVPYYGARLFDVDRAVAIPGAESHPAATRTNPISVHFPCSEENCIPDPLHSGQDMAQHIAESCDGPARGFRGPLSRSAELSFNGGFDGGAGRDVGLAARSADFPVCTMEQQINAVSARVSSPIDFPEGRDNLHILNELAGLRGEHDVVDLVAEGAEASAGGGLLYHPNGTYDDVNIADYIFPVDVSVATIANSLCRRSSLFSIHVAPCKLAIILRGALSVRGTAVARAGPASVLSPCSEGTMMCILNFTFCDGGDDCVCREVLNSSKFKPRINAKGAGELILSSIGFLKAEGNPFLQLAHNSEICVSVLKDYAVAFDLHFRSRYTHGPLACAWRRFVREKIGRVVAMDEPAKDNDDTFVSDAQGAVNEAVLLNPGTTRPLLLLFHPIAVAAAMVPFPFRPLRDRLCCTELLSFPFFGIINSECPNSVKIKGWDDFRLPLFFLFFLYFSSSFFFLILPSGDLSFLQTEGALLKFFGLIQLNYEAWSSGIVPGVRFKTLQQDFVFFLCLLSFFRYEGYLPFVKTGDWLYLGVEFASVAIGLQCYATHGPPMSTYAESADRFDNLRVPSELCSLYVFVPFTRLNILLDPSLNMEFFASIVLTASVYIEALAMSPQLHMFQRQEGDLSLELDAMHGCTIFTVTSSRFFELFMWTESPFCTVSNFPVFLSQVADIATVGDFLYYRSALVRILPCSFHLSGALQRIGLLSNERIDLRPYADRFGNLKGWETPTWCSFLSSSSSCLSSSSSTSFTLPLLTLPRLIRRWFDCNLQFTWYGQVLPDLSNVYSMVCSSQSPAISSSSLSVVTVCDFRKGVLRSKVVDTLRKKKLSRGFVGASVTA